jgi:hypothetical protein
MPDAIARISAIVESDYQVVSRLARGELLFSNRGVIVLSGQYVTPLSSYGPHFRQSNFHDLRQDTAYMDVV